MQAVGVTPTQTTKVRAARDPTAVATVRAAQATTAAVVVHVARAPTSAAIVWCIPLRMIFAGTAAVMSQE